MATSDQARFMAEIEERTQTIRRQADAVLRKAEGHCLYDEVRPTLEGMVTNTSHVLNALDLLRKTLEGSGPPIL